MSQKYESLHVPWNKAEGEGPTAIFLCSISAAVAESATFPIDAVKTRLVLRPVVQGPAPAVLRHFVYTPLRIVAYENLRGAGGGDSLLGRALSGGISGVLAQVSRAPAAIRRGHRRSPEDRTSGGRSRAVEGGRPQCPASVFVNMGELACYDQAKRFVIANQACGDGVYAHTLASFASGLSATALSCPADVIKTRMMNQEGQRVERHSRRGALWKGFLPTWARLGPWQFVFRVSYERLRRAAGLSSF
ncbi:unnamed protein product [Spirodela intermedia]|uniref:Uncharacterized protein n=1 Tax=Spirodela intermedia TaxID=51605 RepID=A0A7I8IW83_SPIIN|nr:unnamed protein product [Spirodela intermedia]CAA6662246.1 unnamed protein product [Spirodela intermedia]